jgi:uncharacterized cupredoxin-like copper-binding protein
MVSLRSRRRIAAFILALVGSACAGCGAQQRAAEPGGAVAVNERDFHISAPARLRAGEVALRVDNHGPDKHELIVARVGPAGAAGLPLRADGLTLNEEALEKSEVGELEPGAPGSVRTLRLNLAPGHYVFFCNMAGHFLGGMHADVVVQ